MLGQYFQSADHPLLEFDTQPRLVPLEAGIQVHMQTYLAEVACMEQGLEKNVHVTCSSLIFQSDKASFLLGVVAVKASDCTASTIFTTAHLIKLCHKTPVGSSNTLTYAVNSALSSSIVGRISPSWTLNNLRSSPNRVNPQSRCSAIKRWFASAERYWF